MPEFHHPSFSLHNKAASIENVFGRYDDDDDDDDGDGDVGDGGDGGDGGEGEDTPSRPDHHQQIQETTVLSTGFTLVIPSSTPFLQRSLRLPLRVLTHLVPHIVRCALCPENEGKELDLRSLFRGKELPISLPDGRSIHGLVRVTEQWIGYARDLFRHHHPPPSEGARVIATYHDGRADKSDVASYLREIGFEERWKSLLRSRDQIVGEIAGYDDVIKAYKDDTGSLVTLRDFQEDLLQACFAMALQRWNMDQLLLARWTDHLRAVHTFLVPYQKLFHAFESLCAIAEGGRRDRLGGFPPSLLHLFRSAWHRCRAVCREELKEAFEGGELLFPEDVPQWTVPMQNELLRRPATVAWVTLSIGYARLKEMVSQKDRQCLSCNGMMRHLVHQISVLGQSPPLSVLLGSTFASALLTDLRATFPPTPSKQGYDTMSLRAARRVARRFCLRRSAGGDDDGGDSEAERRYIAKYAQPGGVMYSGFLVNGAYLLYSQIMGILGEPHRRVRDSLFYGNKVAEDPLSDVTIPQPSLLPFAVEVRLKSCRDMILHYTETTELPATSRTSFFSFCFASDVEHGSVIQNLCLNVQLCIAWCMSSEGPSLLECVVLDETIFSTSPKDAWTVVNEK